VPNKIQLREEIIALAREKCSLDGPLPEGDLSEVLDSVQRLTLVIAIEDHYQICFEPEEDEAVVSLDDVVDLVAARIEDS
jgi:acyl carrier protein